MCCSTLSAIGVINNVSNAGVCKHVVTEGSDAERNGSQQGSYFTSHLLPHSYHLRDEMAAGTMALSQRARKVDGRERIVSEVFFSPHFPCCRLRERDDMSSFHGNIYQQQSSADYHKNYYCSYLLTVTLLSRSLSFMNVKMAMLRGVPLGFLLQICAMMVRNDLYREMTNADMITALFECLGGHRLHRARSRGFGTVKYG
jgi:hypothetical protein